MMEYFTVRNTDIRVMHPNGEFVYRLLDSWYPASVFTRWTLARLERKFKD